MTQSELLDVFSLVRKIAYKETLDRSFYYPEILFLNEGENCTMDNCIYVGLNTNKQNVFIHIAPVAAAAKTIIEISEINLMMLRNFYIPTFDAAHAVYTLYADQLYEFYNSNVNN